MKKIIALVSAGIFFSSANLFSQETAAVIENVTETAEAVVDAVSHSFDGLEDEADVVSSFVEDSLEDTEGEVLKAYNESKNKKEEKPKYKYTKEKNVASKKRPTKHDSKTTGLLIRFMTCSMKQKMQQLRTKSSNTLQSSRIHALGTMPVK